MIQVGDLVRFKSGLYKDEQGAIYVVLEVNQDRVIIEYKNTNMAFRPQSVALISELELINTDTPSESTRT